MRSIKLVKLSSNEDIDEIINSFIDSLYFELSFHPKPGLVTPISQGRHKDMDFFMMFESIPLIRKYLNGLMDLCDKSFYLEQESMVKDSMTFHIEDEELMDYFFSILEEEIERFIHFGAIVENQMFSKTKGVNTYKGIIFTYSILFVAMYIFSEVYEYKLLDNEGNSFNIKRYSYIKTYSYIVQRVGQILASYKINSADLPEDTYGAKVYREYRYRGVLEEAGKGYPIIFDAINFFLRLKEKFSIDSFSYNTHSFEIKKYIFLKLFAFISFNIKDTNILGKKGERVLNEYKDLTEKALNSENITSMLKHLEQLNNLCIKEDISSGGAADIFAATFAMLKIFALL